MPQAAVSASTTRWARTASGVSMVTTATRWRAPLTTVSAVRVPTAASVSRCSAATSPASTVRRATSVRTYTRAPHARVWSSEPEIECFVVLKAN